MSMMISKQIYIVPDQNERLKRMSAELGITEAELIRQAIDKYLQTLCDPRRNLEAWEAERVLIQKLMEQAVVPHDRTWNREELHER